MLIIAKAEMFVDKVIVASISYLGNFSLEMGSSVEIKQCEDKYGYFRRSAASEKLIEYTR